MAEPEKQPLQGGIAAFAAIVSLTVIATAPVLAAPDRTICKDASAPSLDVASTEFSRKQAASQADGIDMLSPGLELAAREEAAEEELVQQEVETAGEEDANAQESNAPTPADASGPLVHKRQMYRRDI